MDQKRSFVFMALSLAVLIAWLNFGPVLFPQLFPQPVKKQPAAQADAEKQPAAPTDEAATADADPADGDNAAVTADAASVDPAEPNGNATETAAAEPATDKPVELAKHPERTVRLGSLKPESGFVQLVELTTRGATVESIALNDSRYSELGAREVPLKVVGNQTDESVETFALSVSLIDAQLQKWKTRLSEVNWEVVPDSVSESEVTFQYVAPDGSLRVSKHYSIEPVPEGQRDNPEIRDTATAPYILKLEVGLENLSPEEQTAEYTLLGPVGLPLENAEHGQKFRDLRTGFLDAEGEVTSGTKDAATVVEEQAENKNVEWKQPIAYLGVDTQYFAALLVPQGDQLKSSQVAYAQPVVIDEAAEARLSDISFRLHSKPVSLAAGEKVEHGYNLYAGPKREELLAPLHAGEIVDFGWFGSISSGMLWLLNVFHDWGIPYGIAIMMLTIMVRACLYPLSKKQALGAKKMKDLQPKIAELRQKYANDKEKLARAQMELFSKHNYNPLAGCLPIFLQLPIFIGLYRALSSSVDLRMAPFLWVDNLAAPDALFQMPFSLPFLGSDFNLLPLITVVLFIFQQKMFMPPPTDEQQALQYKMMNYMMVFMGFMFYHVPAGLCVYFIASSLWGMGERKLLDRVRSPNTDPEAPVAADGGRPEAQPKAGLWKRLGDQLEAAAKRMDTEPMVAASRRSENDKKSKKGSRSRR